MGPVHVYLAAWVMGGVLLGASMLLDPRGRDPGAQRAGGHGISPAPGEGFAPKTSRDDGPQSLVTPIVSSPRPWERSLRVLPLGLVGFGLAGLTATGLDLDRWPWTLLCALSIGVLLIALGYRLSSRARVS